MNRREYVIVSGTALCPPLVAGCTEDETDSDSGEANVGGDGGEGDGSGSAETTNSGDTVSQSATDDRPDFEILEHEFYRETFSGVRGTARNNTDSELSYAQVEVTFLDEADTQIGEGLDNVSELAAGRSWEFDCVYLGNSPERIASYEIEASTGF
ncbi:FxLYD domain-containing protein [Haloarchaeobius sp. HRN-SO-5]|uniref:FxLYD domain-containing protein n=1 Tax=Haloarchaeobius sp. HRN-SO-5 TaxID=3446118 RepID=UPI003EBB0076